MTSNMAKMDANSTRRAAPNNKALLELTQKLLRGDPTMHTDKSLHVGVYYKKDGLRVGEGHEGVPDITVGLVMRTGRPDIPSVSLRKLMVIRPLVVLVFSPQVATSNPCVLGQVVIGGQT